MKSFHIIRSVHIHRPIRSTLAVLAVAALAAAPAVVTPATAASTTAASSCARGWGSTAEAKHGTGGDTIRTVRTGRHACFDRVVFDLRGGTTTYSAQYFPTVFDAGTGRPVPLRGGARLEIVLLINRYDATGHDAFRPANKAELTNVSGYRTFRQLAGAGYSEETARFGLGVRARLPFRTFLLQGPGRSGRLVVDVAHRW